MGGLLKTLPWNKNCVNIYTNNDESRSVLSFSRNISQIFACNGQYYTTTKNFEIGDFLLSNRLWALILELLLRIVIFGRHQGLFH